jgi:hypothetical protein
MKPVLKILLFKFFEIAIELIAENSLTIKGWHAEITKDYRGKVDSICLTRKPRTE